jgi:hypothetical protein
MSINISVHRLIRFLVLVVGCCILVGIAGQILRFLFFGGALDGNWLLGKVIRQFDLNFEGNFPTWLSSSLLLVAALTARLTSCLSRSLNSSESRSWTVIAIMFCYLSLDEASQIHETANRMLVSVIGIPSGVDIFDLVLFVLVGAYLLPFFYHLDSQTQKLFLLSGFLFGVGAVGIELFGHKFLSFYHQETLATSLVTALEESLEMTGVIIFIYTLLRLIAKIKTIEICLVDR